MYNYSQNILIKLCYSLFHTSEAYQSLKYTLQYKKFFKNKPFKIIIPDKHQTNRQRRKHIKEVFRIIFVNRKEVLLTDMLPSQKIQHNKAQEYLGNKVAGLLDMVPNLSTQYYCSFFLISADKMRKNYHLSSICSHS